MWLYNLLKWLLTVGVVMALEVILAVVGGLVFTSTGWSLLSPIQLAQSAAVGTAVIGGPLSLLLLGNKTKDFEPLEFGIAVAVTAAVYTVAGAAIWALTKGQLGFAAASAATGAGIVIFGGLAAAGILFLLADKLCSGTHADVKVPTPE